MFVPLRDDNPIKVITFQYVTVALIVANVIAYLFELTKFDDFPFLASFAVIPSELLYSSAFGSPLVTNDAVAVPEKLTLITYMFLHADWLHLLGNMLFLWVFGDNVEDALGHFRFLVFYLLCGIAAALLHAMIIPDSTVPLIGASGAVAGVIAAYLMMHPRVTVWVLALKVIPLRISAAFVLGFWIILQLMMVLLPPDAGNTAWFAHIGGLLAGAVLITVMRRPGVPLFGR